MLLALLIFLPTLIFFPHVLYSFGILYIPKRIKLNLDILIITSIIILSFFNQIFNYNTSIIHNKSILSFIPYYFFILITYFISRSINDITIKYIILFVCFESVIALIEFFYNVQTFFPNLVTTQLTNFYGYKDLLYYSRAFGLSNNSSELSYKIFISLLLIDTIDFKQKNLIKILYIILFFGIIVTFNRSVILSLIVFYFLKAVSYILIVVKVNLRKLPYVYLLYLFLMLISLFLFLYYFDYIKYQFLRGIDLKLDSYKRNEIYNYFYNFILSHPFFGNGSFKLYYLFQNKLYHGHNSFLQIIATNGIFISLLYFILLFRNINKHNIKFIIPILVLSFFQYAIFWGISILDIFCFYYLFNFKRNVHE